MSKFRISFSETTYKYIDIVAPSQRQAEEIWNNEDYSMADEIVVRVESNLDGEIEEV